MRRPSVSPVGLWLIGAIASTVAAVSSGLAGHHDVTAACALAAVLMIVAAVGHRRRISAARG